LVVAVDPKQQILWRPRRVALPEFLDWAQTHLQSTDAVVLEASVNAWQLYDQITPLVASVTVAHPLLVKAISAAKVKTDARDSTTLARLLAASLIPAVWVPPEAGARLTDAAGPQTALDPAADTDAKSAA
jgi:transposase